MDTNIKIKRAIHFDFHTMPGVYDFNRDWDAEEFAKRLADAHVTYINLFAQCNIGFSYYPTKIGIPYPGMKGDMFGDALRQCHKRGIKVTAYVNAGLNHQQAIEHAEWLRVDKEGRIIRGDRTANFFRTMCFNTGYRDYLLDTIREIKQMYPIDGLFTDCIFAEPCWCAKCTEDMLKEGIDLNDENACYDFSHRKVMETAHGFREILGPELFLTVNGVSYSQTKHLQKHVEIECLTTDPGWGYDAFPKLAAYARNIKDTVVYMTGRFQASWGDFGGYKTVAAIENDLYDALLNGCQLSIGDHMHPAQIMNKDMFRDIGNLYGNFMRYEPWTDYAKYLPEIGVLAEMGATPHLSDSCAGLARMLGELKYNFDILDVLDEAQDYSRFACIILPDTVRVSQKLASKLDAYLQNGGKILSTGFAGLNPDDSGFALSAWDFDFLGKDPSNASYYTFNSLPQGSADMHWSMYREGIIMQARQGGEVFAEYCKPYFNRIWDGKHGYYYTPPEKKTGWHAAAVTGNVGHICFKVFEAYNAYMMREHKLIVAQVLQRLVPNKMITTNMPPTARVTATGNEKYTLVHCKVTYPEMCGNIGIVQEHNVQPAGYEVWVRGDYSAACLLPSETPIAKSFDNGYTTIVLPQIKGFAMLRLDK